MGRTPYDMFMLGFHDYLKENADFQKNCPKNPIWNFRRSQRGWCSPTAWRMRPCPANSRSNRLS